MLVFESVGSRVGELPARLLTELLRLYSLFQQINVVPTVVATKSAAASAQIREAQDQSTAHQRIAGRLLDELATDVTNFYELAVEVRHAATLVMPVMRAASRWRSPVWLAVRRLKHRAAQTQTADGRRTRLARALLRPHASRLLRGVADLPISFVAVTSSLRTNLWWDDAAALTAMAADADVDTQQRIVAARRSLETLVGHVQAIAPLAVNAGQATMPAPLIVTDVRWDAALGNAREDLARLASPGP
jgi:hypothetical protein